MRLNCWLILRFVSRIHPGAWLTAALLLYPALAPVIAMGGEVIPPAPPRYFNDFAGVVPNDAAERLNKQLEDFERQTSSQILVAVYPKMQSDSSVEDYTVRVAEAWKVGQKDKDNGAVLFVFIQDRSMFLQVGYGLEGALPDATAKQIIEFEIKPHFRQGDYSAGLTAGVNAMLQVARGEYKGTGRTVADSREHRGFNPLALMPIVIIVLLVMSRLATARGRVYGRRGYGNWHSGWGGGGWSSGGGGGGGGWSSGGGGFSGGGGSFGGGGAGGRW